MTRTLTWPLHLMASPGSGLDRPIGQISHSLDNSPAYRLSTARRFLQFPPARHVRFQVRHTHPLSTNTTLPVSASPSSRSWLHHTLQHLDRESSRTPVVV